MTTTTLHDFTLLPDIVIGQADYKQLTVLALAGSEHTADTSDALLSELDRALVIPDGRVPDDVVRMGSTVQYRTSEGDTRQVVLVYPAEANISEGRISVLTPVGAALIGLSKGQSITWITRGGRKQVLTVLAVVPPGPTENDEDPGPAAA